MIRYFISDISKYEIPNKFNFPFFYEPHPLCELAAHELQLELENNEWNHNFWKKSNTYDRPIGKMFGVLLVRDQQDKIGYLAAFSGKLAGTNNIKGFVPPVFDMLTRDGYYKANEAELNVLTNTILDIETNSEYLNLKNDLAINEKEKEAELSSIKSKIKREKKERKIKREALAKYGNQESLEILENLKKQSIQSSYYLKDKKYNWSIKIEKIKASIARFDERIIELKTQRKNKSKLLQEYLFEQYTFLNMEGDEKSLLDIFKHTIEGVPPAGAGECTAPKLLQYAFANELQPLSIAEFWWGESPSSAIRKHKHFYPSCRRKCEPILAHMLAGITIQVNPALSFNADEKLIKVIFEDEHIALIRKPHGLLSVPGKNIEDSVWLRMKQKYRKATGPIIVHRLDMATSGIMIIAKTIDAYKNLQKQFITKTVLKRYIAILEGKIEKADGEIDLPLRVDLDNRPHQLVCYQYGKKAFTKWEKIEESKKETLVYFYPITGRTHQLRMHAAHQNGLNSPIKGDALYGRRNKRLYLHAESIEFFHPITKDKLRFNCPSHFKSGY